MQYRCPACGKGQELPPSGAAHCSRCNASLGPLRDLVQASRRHEAQALAALRCGDMRAAQTAAEQAHHLHPTELTRRLRLLSQYALKAGGQFPATTSTTRISPTT